MATVVVGSMCVQNTMVEETIIMQNNLKEILVTNIMATMLNQV